MEHLSALGWNDYFQNLWDALPDRAGAPARIVEEQREVYGVATAAGEMTAEVTGHFRHTTPNPALYPAIGDWVAVRTLETERKALIHAVLPRRTTLSRHAAGDRHRPEHRRSEAQVLAANIDTVLAVASLNADLNRRRIERYLSAIRASGAQPVLVLNKADLCPDAAAAQDEVAVAAPGVPVHVVSARAGSGIDVLAAYLGRGRTAVLVGSSGVGKSTLINRLLGREVQATRKIRSDDRGQHATTNRRLFRTPFGGCLIDSPGIRELQLWDGGEGGAGAFDDIGRLAGECRFADCGHDMEPGCAVRAAIAGGALAPGRLDNYRKIRLELDHLERRTDAAARAEHRKMWKQRQKAMRRLYRSRDSS